jgi:hypothetical protein
LAAAWRYAKIAPDSPHALHMPSHIFTRLGLWDESIDSNLASVASAERNNAPGNELHAKDYLIYAYLQEGRDSEAKNALKAVLHGRADDPPVGGGALAERHLRNGSIAGLLCAPGRPLEPHRSPRR